MAPRVAEDRVEFLIVKKAVVYSVRKFNLDLNNPYLTILACYDSSREIAKMFCSHSTRTPEINIEEE